MDYVQLKHTDLKVSRIVLGTMTFGGQADEASSLEILDYAIDCGVNFIDTANAYNHGVTESILGRYLKGKRHQLIVASKVFNKMGEGPDMKGLSRAAILRAAEDSLKRLQTDYLDVYYLHQPDWSVPIEESLEAVDQLVRAGKVRYPASSNYASWQIVQMQHLAASNGWRPARITQPMYNLLARGIEQEYLAMTAAYELSTIVYNPLAGGLLTGKHKRERVTPGTRFDNNRMYQDRYWHDDMFDAVEALEQTAQREGRSLISLALNWLYRHTPVDAIILGATQKSQLEENLRVLNDGPLSDHALRTCDVVWQALRGPTPKYNR
ncbi:MAG: aldo/keto reductase [Bryobacteraceae bacterium]|nr:aldo/keto reductase [Bryobacteraceae bacterium]MDW8377853.1 aldo/keto reductase [Bryobacterales bacterium]